MFKSAQVLASTTLLCCVLALSGCGASQAGQEAEGTSAQPSASASVKPGTIRVASDGATPSVTPGSITVVNSPEAENHGSSSEHSESSSHTQTRESKQNSDSHSSESSHEGSEKNKSDDSDSQQDSQKSSNSSSQSGSNSSADSSNSSGSSSSSNSSNSSNSSGSSEKSSNSSSNTVAEGPTQCDLDDLNISVAVGEGSPGARNYTLYFQNSSNSSCTLRGYPRVVHAGPSGTWVGREASASAEYMNSAGVTLNPGDSTTAVLRSVYPARFGDDCGSRPVQGFLVGLPSGSGGVIVPLDTAACSSSVPQLSVGQFGAR
ncbi:peptide ABC transporter permease [Rothia sp. HMSC066H02]|uniref:DUF4232 domain-containing protein n=1 Tax=unclassified Rothia (in: high G+C Gram-positive bacteria) TaxID=2689056 RepID=UPI0008A13831|nr:MULTISPECIES: DUF4232 domain-containing protein [unclassified Rothia (in: high G+C Gram-positive bacteria)]OFO98302.1 peptide ABC transporter permease [Rothia sp. HMSC065D09]OFP12129.1 peptide ABC transporter permease [Rothia sp. HMSC066H02]